MASRLGHTVRRPLVLPAGVIRSMNPKRLAAFMAQASGPSISGGSSMITPRKRSGCLSAAMAISVPPSECPTPSNGSSVSGR